MSWQDVRHHYEDRDDEPEPDPEPVRIVCAICKKVLYDPPGAVRTEVDDACSAACEATVREWEKQRDADYDAAMEEECAAEAERLSQSCQWCGQPVAGGGTCAECVASVEYEA